MKLLSRYLLRPINLLWLVLLVAAVWALDYLPIKEIWSTLQGLNPIELGLWLALTCHPHGIVQPLVVDHSPAGVPDAVYAARSLPPVRLQRQLLFAGNPVRR